MSSYFMLILMLLVGGTLTAAAAVVIMAVALLRPPRMTDGKALWVLRRVSPLDVGLPYEDMNFAVRDEQTGRTLKVAGWWIGRADADGRCVVMIHGYADAKIGTMAWAPLWHHLGYNILAIDLRAHGESGGTHSAAGFWERHDVSQVIDQLRSQRPAATRQLALFGVSLGASVAAATAALRDDLLAVVLDSPYALFCNTAMIHMQRLGAPALILQRASLRLAESIAHADFSATRLDEILPKVAAPVMIVSGGRDVMVSPQDSQALANAMARRRAAGRTDDVIWCAENSDHLNVLHHNPAEYEQRLNAFLSDALQAGHRARVAMK